MFRLTLFFLSFLAIESFAANTINLGSNGVECQITDGVLHCRGCNKFGLECTYETGVNCPTGELIINDQSVTIIAKGTFAQCEFTSADLSGTKVTTINHGAFAHNAKLTEVIFPSTLETIGQLSFADTDLTEVDLSGTKVTNPTKAPFDCSKLQTLKLAVGTSLDEILGCSSVENIYLTESSTIENGDGSGKSVSIITSNQYDPTDATRVEAFVKAAMDASAGTKLAVKKAWIESDGCKAETLKKSE